MPLGPKPRRSYNEEFKREAVKLAESIGATQAAHDLGPQKGHTTLILSIRSRRQKGHTTVGNGFQLSTVLVLLRKIEIATKGPRHYDFFNPQ